MTESPVRQIFAMNRWRTHDRTLTSPTLPSADMEQASTNPVPASDADPGDAGPGAACPGDAGPGDSGDAGALAEAPLDEIDRRTDWVGSIPFIVVHLVAIGGIAVTGWSWSGALLALSLYYVRMFGITAGYHRYFAHRAFRTSRAFQFILALLAMSSSQKGVMWWAAHHRVHHKLSDKPGDKHSVLLDGFLYSHVGWILARGNADTNTKLVKDLNAFPELRFLDRFWYLPPTLLALGLYLGGGVSALFWGFFVSTTVLWHGTFTINSVTHMFGRRRYPTTDNSRNSAILAVVTMGEGWHNNHHYYQSTANQGFYWWEFDPTYYILRLLAVFGIVWDLRTPPLHVRESWVGKEAPLVTREQAIAASFVPKTT
jgi:stearoyl-CoA desaturase (Delta-9 desaturase)